MANAGWIGTAIPEARGGSGMGITEASLVLEELRQWGGHERGDTTALVDVWHGARGGTWLGGDETDLPATSCSR